MATPVWPIPPRLIERAVQQFEWESQRARVARRDDEPAGGSAPTGRVITLSRQLGSGGRLIAERLGAWLGWPVWDKQILDVLAGASSRPLQARLFEALDEKGRGEVEALLAALFSTVSDFSYQYLLPKAILTIAQQDAIVVGRGAHLYLPEALKVRVVAPEAVRVANLGRYDGLDAQTALRRLRVSDRERAAFRRSVLRHLDRVRPVETGELEYDLVLNTATLGLEAAARLVLDAAAARFGLAVEAGSPVAPALSHGAAHIGPVTERRSRQSAASAPLPGVGAGR